MVIKRNQRRAGSMPALFCVEGKMIYVVCGLIGAGKSTYAKKICENVTECEDITKAEQIKETEKLATSGKDVAHVTTYPTSWELDFFETQKQVKYIWVNTTEEQCYRNILRRGRLRDIANIGETVKKNREIERRAQRSKLDFQMIDVFDSGERW